ncbi:MAG: beta-Ala-His dipeptidase [bacterium]
MLIPDFKLWKYFGEISKIPRCSGKEQQAGKFIKNFTRGAGLRFKEDTAGNILVFKPALNSCSKRTVVLQSHLDMVCEKGSETKFDFSNDAVKLRKTGNFIEASGTTLGADNGIGVAAMLAVLSDKEMPHPPLECLFTVSEETGLTGLIGASRVSVNFLSGRTFLNLDSEEEGTVCTGCAGGAAAVLKMPVIFTALSGQGFSEFEISVSGLRGGHSGMDIHKKRASAIKILTEILNGLCRMFDIRISKIEGGTKINAIPRSAGASVFISEKQDPEFKNFLKEHTGKIKERYGNEKQIKIQWENRKAAGKKYFCGGKAACGIVKFISKLPHGLIKKDKSGVVTSANFAILRTGKKWLEMRYLCRSSSPNGMGSVIKKLEALGRQYNCLFSSKEVFPAWEPVSNSRILGISRRSYKKIFSKKLRVKTAHAGLECGVIGKKFGGMDMISIGPDIENAHTPSERVKISSVRKFYKFLKGLLKEL